MDARRRTDLPHPFAGLKVVELADDPAGEFSGRLLAEMGAEVVKLEPPGGAASRRIGPFANGEAGPETSLNFWYYNSNKRSVTTDLATPEGRASLERLLACADILVSTLQPKALAAAGLDLARLTEAHPKLIVLSITPFGLTGPWADYKSSDLVALAAGGPLNSCGYDDHSIPPIRPGGNQAYHSAASFAQIAVMLALIERQTTGRGQLVDVSMHEACAVNVELATTYWFYPRLHVHRQTCRHALPGPTEPAIFRCADGRYVNFNISVAEGKAWQSMVAWMDAEGLAEDLTGPEYAQLAHRQAQVPHIQQVVERFFASLPAERAYHDGQAAGLPVGVLNAPEDLFEDAHLQARGFFVEVEHEGLGPVAYPGSIYRFSSFGEVPRTRAPKLGEHNDTVLADPGRAQMEPAS